MKFVERFIPFEDRLMKLSGDTKIIWPLCNIQSKNEPCELFLDAHHIRHTQWSSSLSVKFKRTLIVNPLPAFLSEALLNPEFELRPYEHIDSMIGGLKASGHIFHPEHADINTRLLMNNLTSWRYQYGILFPFISIGQSLLSPDLPAEVAERLFRKVLASDIPLFISILAPMALCIVLRRNFSDASEQEKEARTLLEKYFSKKNTQSPVSSQYVLDDFLNRGMLLLQTNLIQLLVGSSYKFAGVPAIATSNPLLFRVIFRAFSLKMTEKYQIGLVPDMNVFGERNISDAMALVSSTSVRPASDSKTRMRRLKNLFELAISLCEQSSEKKALLITWQDWVKPGADRALQI